MKEACATAGVGRMHKWGKHACMPASRDRGLPAEVIWVTVLRDLVEGVEGERRGIVVGRSGGRRDVADRGGGLWLASDGDDRGTRRQKKPETVRGLSSRVDGTTTAASKHEQLLWLECHISGAGSMISFRDLAS